MRVSGTFHMQHITWPSCCQRPPGQLYHMQCHVLAYTVKGVTTVSVRGWVRWTAAWNWPVTWHTATPARFMHRHNKENVTECVDLHVKLKRGYFQTLHLIENELDRRFDQKDLTVAASREKLPWVDKGESRADELMIQSKLPASSHRDKLQCQLLQLAQMLKLKGCKVKLPPKFRNIEEWKRCSSSVSFCSSQAGEVGKRVFSCLMRVKTRLVKIACFLRSINRHEKDRLID